MTDLIQLSMCHLKKILRSTRKLVIAAILLNQSNVSINHLINVWNLFPSCHSICWIWFFWIFGNLHLFWAKLGFSFCVNILFELRRLKTPDQIKESAQKASKTWYPLVLPEVCAQDFFFTSLHQHFGSHPKHNSFYHCESVEQCQTSRLYLSSLSSDFISTCISQFWR